VTGSVSTAALALEAELMSAADFLSATGIDSARYFSVIAIFCAVRSLCLW